MSVRVSVKITVQKAKGNRKSRGAAEGNTENKGVVESETVGYSKCCGKRRELG